VSKILRLLRVVHNLCVDAHDTSGRLDGPDEKLFVNNKLTAKLTRQLEETMILASNCLPEWASELPKHFSFLFPFETRYNFLRSTSFGYGRLIAHWQASQPRNNNNNRRDDNLSHLSRLVRQKVRISRAQLLESCAKVLEVYGTSNGILEVEYFDEIGTGLGPTLEFYSLASKEFARRSLKMWRDEDETKEGAYVFHPHGLFPAPALPNEPSIETAGSRLAYFKTLGLFVGRALLDSRIIDLSLNKVFLKLLLGKPVKKSIATLKLVDATLARSLERLQSYLQSRKEIEALVSLPASSRRAKLAALTINGAKLADLSLDLTLPGYDIELRPGGRLVDVDDSNLEEYLELVLDKTLGSGVQPMVKAFQEGFSMIFPIQHLEIFSPEEVGLLCGNVDEDWSRESEYIPVEFANISPRAVDQGGPRLQRRQPRDQEPHRGHVVVHDRGAPPVPPVHHRRAQAPHWRIPQRPQPAVHRCPQAARAAHQGRPDAPKCEWKKRSSELTSRS